MAEQRSRQRWTSSTAGWRPNATETPSTHRAGVEPASERISPAWWSAEVVNDHLRVVPNHADVGGALRTLGTERVAVQCVLPRDDLDTGLPSDRLRGLGRQ